MFDNDFAGEHFVFFTTVNGKKKAIKQNLGSGVCVIKSEIYDIEIMGDSLFLINGLDLKSAKPTSTLNLLLSQDKSLMIEEGKPLTLFSKTPIVYNWATTEVCDEVNFKQMLKIEIQENEIYKTEVIEDLRLEK